MPLRRYASLLIAAIAVLGTVTPPSDARASTCAHIHSTPAKAGRHVVEGAVRCQINVVRVGHGLRPLRSHGILSSVARRHSGDMVRRHYFAHTTLGGPDFVERIRGSGYLSTASHWMLGENLAWGSGRLATVHSIVDAWMHSPPHRHVILTPGYREIGVGVAWGAPRRASSPAATYTADFAARP